MNRYLSKLIFIYRKKIVLPINYPILFKNNQNTSRENRFHLDLAMEWLKNAQNLSGNIGIPASFDFISNKWQEPYRETTGYSIPTYIAFSKFSGKKEYIERSILMGNWEIKNQDISGGIGEPENNGKLRLKIFNTGQVILGWCSLYDETKDNSYLIAASKAADWIIINQEPDGTWIKYSNNGPKSFDIRVAWALLELFNRTNDTRYFEAATKTIKWVLKQQNKNGWIINTSLSQPNKPWTHLIAYTIGGLIKCGLILDDEKLLRAAEEPSKIMAEYFLQQSGDNYLPTTFNEEWKSNDKHSCLTGNCQMAFIWLQLYKIIKSDLFYKATQKMIDQMKSFQYVKTSNLNIKGGIAGSYPIDGPYATLSIPNWGVKFFADMLLLENGQNEKLLG